jgi:hypothetical protein
MPETTPLTGMRCGVRRQTQARQPAKALCTAVTPVHRLQVRASPTTQGLLA